VVVTLPVCVTADVDAARARAGRLFSLYGHLPSYRAMLDREERPVLPTWPSSAPRSSIRRHRSFRRRRATEFSAAAFGTPDEVTRTQALLGALS